MGIKMATPIKEIDKIIEEEKKRAEAYTIRALSYLGERCVIEARFRPQSDSWYDQSGNLRSSIGYIISHNGKIIKYYGFEKVKNGNDGKTEGKSLAEELADKYRTGYVLIVVAGMNYAEYVEAMENKNVLASAELLARKEFPNMMRKLSEQIVKL